MLAMATVLGTALFGCLRTNYNESNFNKQYISLKHIWHHCLQQVCKNTILLWHQWVKRKYLKWAMGKRNNDFWHSYRCITNIFTFLLFALMDPILYQMCLYFTETTYIPSYWQLYGMFFWLIKYHAVINFRISQWQSDLLLGDGCGEMGRQEGLCYIGWTP